MRIHWICSEFSDESTVFWCHIDHGDVELEWRGARDPGGGFSAGFGGFFLGFRGVAETEVFGV